LEFGDIKMQELLVSPTERLDFMIFSKMIPLYHTNVSPRRCWGPFHWHLLSAWYADLSF
jgi:hypothetical protein